MCCFCTAGLPIRAILAISEDVVSCKGEVTKPLLFPIFVTKSMWICERGWKRRDCSSPT